MNDRTVDRATNQHGINIADGLTGYTPRNNVERFLIESFPGNPGIRDMFITVDEEIDAELRSLGYEGTGEQFAERRKQYDDRCNAMIARAGGALPICGAKPKRGDAIRIVDLPGSDIVIRLFDGGLQDARQYLLDFIDRHTRAPVNAPEDYVIYRLAAEEADTYPLKSWETATGISRDHVPPGEERFSVIEALTYRVEYPTGFVEFVAPVRQAQNLVPVVEAVQN
ncbi:uncharacterized protein C8Q71DRAFT_860149 [Rhodofomes roseus]|uniref:Uncharacterized protein n=1 Tax=Rhodofomes roseus TaxID=34475 RepID=A0A4Y9Y4I7_9APHY|nr:uncharacterized protein C8Q71DRAFT_860149 [Rhodofomes roseus]KAH9833884.1 hypothetical protein C8Q71DRAFT_860149 [Rhodofomes roseus]TFY56331.1 hypothetical protein EVJ58_g7709 [Rhodofomes roseus]